MSTLRRRAMRAAAWNVLLGPVNAALGLVGTAFLARLLGLEGYGVYAVAIAAQATVLSFGDLGITTAAGRAFAQTQALGGGASVRKLSLGLLALRLLQCSLLALLGGLLVLAVADDKPSLGSFDFALRIAALIVLEGVSGLAVTVLASLLLQRQALVAVVLSSASRAIGFGVLVAEGRSELANALDVTLAASVIKLIVAMWFLFVGLRHTAAGDSPRPGWMPDQADFVRSALSSWWDKTINFTHSAQVLVLVAAPVFSVVHLGAFALAADLAARVLVTLMTPLNSLMLPLLSEVFAVRSDPTGRARVFAQLIRASALLLLPGTAVLAGVAAPLIRLVLPDDAELATIPFQTLVIFGGIEFTLYTAANAAWLALGRYRAFVAVRSASLVLLVAYIPALLTQSAIWLAVANGSLQAAAATWLAIALFATAPYLAAPTMSLLRIGAAAGLGFVTSLVVTAALQPDAFALLVGAAVGIGSALVTLSLVRELSWHEFVGILRVIRSPGAS